METIDENGINIKVANKEEKYWIDMKAKAESILETLEADVKFHKAVVEMCKAKIEIEAMYQLDADK